MDIFIHLTSEQVQAITKMLDPNNEVYDKTSISAGEIEDYVVDLIDAAIQRR